MTVTTDCAGPLDRMDARITEWMARYSVVMARVALGVSFVWFGALKFFPGLSDAAPLAGRTMSTLTLGYVPPTSLCRFWRSGSAPSDWAS
jgi:hypothetical protein